MESISRTSTVTNQQVVIVVFQKPVHHAGVRSIMLHGNEICPVRVKDMCCLERNDVRMVQWMRRLNLESIRTCMQNRRLRWFGHIERKDERVW